MLAALMPGFGGKRPSTMDIALWLRGGIRSDSSPSGRAKRKTIEELEAGLTHDLHLAPTRDDVSEDE